MRISEKTYEDLNQVYWHGSQYQDVNMSKSRFGMFYMSPHFEYAIRYARQPDGHWGYMMKCRLSKPLDIFNAEDAKDVLKLKRYLASRGIGTGDIDYILSYLYSEDWITLNKSDINRHKLLNYLIDLGYDGFFNYEEAYKSPAIGLFSDDLMVIDKVLNEEDIIAYISNDDMLSAKRRRDMERLLTGNPFATGHLVSYDDLLYIYKNRPSLEEYKKGICRNISQLEEMSSDDPNGCRVRLESLNRELKVLNNLDKYREYIYLDQIF